MNAFVDYCDFRISNNNPIQSIVFSVIDKYTNATHNCPFIAPEMIIIKDLEIPTKGMPEILPVGDYRVNLEFYNDANETLRYALLQVFATVRALTLVDLRMG